MYDSQLYYLGLRELSGLIASKKVSPLEVVRSHLARIEATEATLNSFITLPGEEVLEEARRATEEIQTGAYRGPLHGIPVGLKDLYYVKGVRNTSGSRIYDRFLPEYDSTVAARLKKAGAIIMGKLNLHQFAFGPTGLNVDYGNMHNPWDTDRIAGGSSGGSGSAAAAGQCTVTLGTDTGGSIRIPSALCGLAGLKPTYGRVSRYGISPLSWSLDHAGPMARSVEDCALTLNVLAGYDPKDPTSVNKPVPDYTDALTGDIRGLRVGVPREYFEVPIDPHVRANVMNALEALRELGAQVKEVSWPMFHDSADISSTILYTEAASYHENLIMERGDEYDPSIRLRLEVGLFISGVEYLRALRGRSIYTSRVKALLQDVDILVGPMEPVVAPNIDAEDICIDGKTVTAIQALTQYTRPFNITGFPALTIPCGFANGMPVGVQLAGRPFDEATVLNAGYSYQQSTGWHKLRPPI